MKKTLNEQNSGCLNLQNQNPELYSYCMAHCTAPGSSFPSECPDYFLEECCPGGCTEMIDDTHPLWPDCVKCWSNGEETQATGEDCECCRPLEDEDYRGYNCRPGHIRGTSMCVPCSTNPAMWEIPCEFGSEQECIESGCEETSNVLKPLKERFQKLANISKK